MIMKGMYLPQQFHFEPYPTEPFLAQQSQEFNRYHQEMLAAGFKLKETVSTESMLPTVSHIVCYQHTKHKTLCGSIINMNALQNP